MIEIELWSNQLDGFWLAKSIQELVPQVSIIFVTVWNEYGLSHKLFELCVNSLIPKSWNKEKLAATI